MVARPLLERLVLDASGYLERGIFAAEGPALAEELAALRRRLEQSGCAAPGVETKSRYAWIEQVVSGAVHEPDDYLPTWTDRLDRVLTHRVWGTVIFAALMIGLFQAVFSGAVPFMDLIEAGCAWLGAQIEAHMAEGALRSLLASGLVGGVGGVLVFLPQILILFFFIGILEDCGYMARAAYLMDRFMSRVGLSGKSFIPMLAAFACAIPGIMAARVIENDRDRLTTILVAPLMTCSARLPVFALLIAAFIPDEPILGVFDLRGVTLFGLYALGILTAVVVALLLKRTLRAARRPCPSSSCELLAVLQHGRCFTGCWNGGCSCACARHDHPGCSIVVWGGRCIIRTTPRRSTASRTSAASRQPWIGWIRPGRTTRRWPRNSSESGLGEFQRQSWLGRAGRAVEPVFKPLGWDWRIGCAVIASFPAREIVVATLGVVFDLGENADAQSETGEKQFRDKLRQAAWNGSDRRLFTVPTALSIMVFFALCAQCAATLAAIRRETNSLRWPAFTFAYMTTLAYLGALVAYQAGTWIAARIG